MNGKTEDYLRDIAARSSFLFERLDMVSSPPIDEKLIEKRLGKWAESLSPIGDRKALDDFLAWSGMTFDDACRAVSPVEWAGERALPRWTRTLEQALEIQVTINDRFRFIDAEKPAPFEILVAPFVLQYRHALEEKPGHDLLNADAHRDLERSLMLQLSYFAVSAFQLEFQVFSLRRHSSLFTVSGIQEKGKTLYNNFVENMLQDGLHSFYAEYVALARVLATMTTSWQETQSELLARLAEDYEAIVVQHSDHPLGKVAAIKSPLSDPHRGRRTVASLKFESGLRLIYKPKDLKTAEVFNRLIGWINERAADTPALRTLNILIRDEYAWVEYIEHESCQGESDVRDYYVRLGMLLGVLHLCRATDCHYENIIANGPYPTFVDTETLFQSAPPQYLYPFPPDSVQYSAIEKLANSALRTHLLPSWMSGKDEQYVYDYSGVGTFAEQLLPHKSVRWSNVNTDHMMPVWEQTSLPVGHSIPSLDEATISIAAYTQDFLNGFRQVYDLFLEHRDELCDSLLLYFDGVTTRYVLRATHVYSMIIWALRHPKYLRDGVDFSIPIEKLARAFLAIGDKSPRIILEAERAALYRLDVPLFAVQSDQTELVLETTGSIPDYFDSSGAALVRAGVEALSLSDREEELAIIQGALATRFARGHHTSTIKTAIGEDIPRDHNVVTGFVEEAVKIGDRLIEQSLRGPGGDFTWIAPQLMPHAERFQFQPLGYHFYDGLSGIAFYFAALGKASGEARFSEAANSLTLSIIERASDDRVLNQALRDVGIGGLFGLGTTLYALVRIGEFLSHPPFIEAGLRLAHIISDETIEKAHGPDIFYGLSAVILSLLALYESVDESAILGKAKKCGKAIEALLAEQLPEAGFARGIDGIRYALKRLADSSGEPSVPGLSAIGDPPNGSADWYHGASGWGQAKLYFNESIDAELQVACDALRQPFALADHAVGGVTGILDFLINAAERLEKPALLNEARQTADWMIKRAVSSGSFLSDEAFPEGLFNPGLFRGMAGVGYGMLRLADPVAYSSFLILD